MEKPDLLSVVAFQKSLLATAGNEQECMRPQIKTNKNVGSVATQRKLDQDMLFAIGDQSVDVDKKCEMVAELLGRGANPDASRNDGVVTALTLAISCGSTEMVEVLIKAGADAGWRHPKDGTDLLSSWPPPSPKIAMLLLDAGVDPWGEKNGNRTLQRFSRSFRPRLMKQGDRVQMCEVLLRIIRSNPSSARSLLEYSWSWYAKAVPDGCLQENRKNNTGLGMLLLCAMAGHEELAVCLNRDCLAPPMGSDVYFDLWDSVISEENLQALQYCTSIGWVPKPVNTHENGDLLPGWAWKALQTSFENKKMECFLWLMMSPVVKKEFLSSARENPSKTIFNLAKSTTFTREKWEWLRELGVDFSAVGKKGETLAHILLRNSGGIEKAKTIINWLVDTDQSWQLAARNNDGHLPREGIRQKLQSPEQVQQEAISATATAERRALDRSIKNDPDREFRRGMKKSMPRSRI